MAIELLKLKRVHLTRENPRPNLERFCFGGDEVSAERDSLPQSKDLLSPPSGALVLQFSGAGELVRHIPECHIRALSCGHVSDHRRLPWRLSSECRGKWIAN